MNKWECLKHNYIDKDIKIIPIQVNKKIPLIPKWNQDCSSDKMQKVCISSGAISFSAASVICFMLSGILILIPPFLVL